MGKMGREIAMGLGMTAAIGGGTYEGVKALEPVMEKGHIEAMVGDHEEQIKSTTRDIQGVVNTIDNDLKDPAITPDVKNKLEIQKKAFLLAMRALEGGKPAPQEKK